MGSDLRQRYLMLGILDKTMIRRLYCIGVLCLAPLPALAQVSDSTPENELVSIYSDICLHEETGDLGGRRIFLIRGDGRGYEYYVAVQWAEGGLGMPLLVPAFIQGGEIRFRLEESGYVRNFIGQLTEEHLVGYFEEDGLDVDGEPSIKLSRQPNVPGAGFSC